MSLKAALQADLAEKQMNLGDLAEKLEIKQQSVSKWIAKDEIPQDRLEQVLSIVGGPDSRTAQYIVQQTTSRLRGAMGAKAALKSPPQPGDEDEEPVQFQYAAHIDLRPSSVREAEPQTNVIESELDGKRVGYPNSPLFRRHRTESWARLLPGELKANVLVRIQINGGFREFDYLSDKLALMVRPVPVGDPTRLVHTAMPLLLLRAQTPGVRCTLVLLPPEKLRMPTPHVRISDGAARVFASRMELVKQDLRALGVNVVKFDEPMELALMIGAAEDPMRDEEVFSYEDWPEDTLTPADRESGTD